MRSTYSVDIRATPERIFTWLDDAKRCMEWCDWCVESEDLAVAEGRVGSTFRQVYVEGGRRMEFFGTCTEYVANKRLGARLTGERFDLEVHWSLAPMTTATRLTQTSRVRFKGLMKLLGPLMTPFMRKAGLRQLEGDFGRLKELCEAVPPREAERT